MDQNGLELCVENQTVGMENVAASYHAGVLKLELKKNPEAQPRQIQIKVA